MGTLFYFFPGLVGPFRPSHVHAGLVGFFLQMVMGVAYWMMPNALAMRRRVVTGDMLRKMREERERRGG